MTIRNSHISKTPIKLANVKYVAQYLGVSVPTIWRWARENEDFPAPVKVGSNCTRWQIDEIDAWLGARSAA